MEVTQPCQINLDSRALQVLLIEAEVPIKAAMPPLVNLDFESPGETPLGWTAETKTGEAKLARSTTLVPKDSKASLELTTNDALVTGSLYQMTRHPNGVDGTSANSMVHGESTQLIIGPHIIDKNHNIRTVEALINIRLCGTACHLSDPTNLFYMLGMEGELFELNIHTLETNFLFDLTKVLGTPGEGSCHFKDCHTAFSRLMVTNDDYAKGGQRREGPLAEWDGKYWRALEHKSFKPKL